jgi:hypothetical protein
VNGHRTKPINKESPREHRPTDRPSQSAVVVVVVVVVAFGVFTFVFFPSSPPKQKAFLSFVIAVALRRSLSLTSFIFSSLPSSSQSLRRRHRSFIFSSLSSSSLSRRRRH